MMKKIHILNYYFILLTSVGKNAASIFCFYKISAASNQRRLLIKGGFYSEAASIQENTVS